MAGIAGIFHRNPYFGDSGNTPKSGKHNSRIAGIFEPEWAASLNRNRRHLWSRIYIDESEYKSTSFSYDERGNITALTESGLLTETQSFAYHTSYEYDADGQMTKFDGPRTDVFDIITYDYDTSGNLTSITLPFGGSWTYEDHDACGNPGAVADANGNRTSIEYDALNRVTKLTHESDNVSEFFFYDGLGNVTRVTKGNGNSYDFSYVQKNRLAAIHNSFNERILFSYDSLGNITRREIYNGEQQLQKSLK